MRIVNLPPVTPTQQVGSSQRTARTGSSFRLPDEPEEARSTGNTRSASALGSLDALLALQGVNPDKERRRKQMRRARVSLDLLDELKIGMLSGDLSPAVLLRLKAAMQERLETTGDAGLDDVLGQIDVRTQVELAKIEARKSR